jgi:ribonuclease HI
MSEPGVLRIHTDGAARGNPGPAAFAYIIERDDGPAIEEKGLLGTKTNNVAEYTALVKALEHAARLGAGRVDIRTDSDLMVNQLKGLYKVKNEGLRPYYERARVLLRDFDDWDIRHVPRNQNSRADRLCNQALDSAAAKDSGPAARSRTPGRPAESRRLDTVRAEALDCLRAVAAAWARGNPEDPRPEDVWDQLWTILEEGGVLRPGRKQ